MLPILGPGNDTTFIVPCRPGFNDVWKVSLECRKKPQTFKTYLDLRRKGIAMADVEMFFDDRLGCCLSTLLREDMSLDRYALLLAALDEHLLEASKSGNNEELARLDEMLYALYSDLSAILQLLTAIHLQRPKHVNTRDLDGLKRSEFGIGKGWSYISRGFLEQNYSKEVPNPDGTSKTGGYHPETIALMQLLATPTPTGPRLSQTWLDKDQAQRAALSKFWATMRNCHRRTLQQIDLPEYYINSDLRSLSADIDPRHISEVNAEREIILQQIAERDRQKTTKRARASLGEPQTQWGLDNVPVVRPVEAKLKAKTPPSLVEDPLAEYRKLVPAQERLASVWAIPAPFEDHPSHMVTVSKRAFTSSNLCSPRTTNPKLTNTSTGIHSSTPWPRRGWVCRETKWRWFGGVIEPNA
jgi:hypothetical protein